MQGDASHDQACVAGETKGQYQEKGAQALEGAKEKVEQASQKAHEKAQAAKDLLLAESTQKDETKEHARDTAEAGDTEKAGGNLKATTEQVKSAADGAADAVKRTFGVGEGDDKQKTN